MKKILVITLIILSLGLNLFLYTRLKKKQVLAHQIENKPSDELQQIKSIYHLMYGNLFVQLKSEDCIIKNVTGTLKNNETTELKSQIAEGMKLVFRYNENNCNVCVEQALLPLMKYSPEIGIENILILTTYQNVRILQVYLNKYAPGIKVFNTSENLEIPIENWDTPYFFVTDKSLKAQSVFIPAKEISGYTQEYLGIIQRKYFNDK